MCVLHDCIHSDLSNLSEGERASYGATFSPATYTFIDLKRDVLNVLRGHFGGGIVSGGKAIPIPASGSRRKADMLAAVEFRRYFRFAGLHDQSYEEGLCFFDASGQRIENFPRQHSRNLTAKHQATMQWFKPTVRVIKNLRRCLVERGMIADGVAPSYYLEGLLYNAPNVCFGRSYQDTIMHVLDWIIAADRSRFVCANQLYYLLWEGSPVAWRAARCDEFLQAASELWRHW